MDTAMATTTESDVPLEHLEHEICALSAHLAAATCRWLELIAEFDRREGWGALGARSCAHWLNWQCGVSMATAHEHVRVARRLIELPLARDAFASGQLSYSKVRALSRIAGPQTEEQLVGLARHATAAHLDRVARARRAVGRGDERQEANRRSEARHLHYFWDDDGSLVLTARLDPEEGALFLQALEAASHALRTGDESEGSSAEDSAGEVGASSPDEAGGEVEDSPAGESTTSPGEPGASRPQPAPRPRKVPNHPDRADALVAMAETTLRHGPAARDGGDKYQVVLLVDAGVLAGRGADAREGRCEIEDGPHLAAKTALRLACDAAVVAASLKNRGEPLDVGRSTQSIPRAIRRALRLRDRGCRFPGCTQTRFVDGHHIVYWAHGGRTSLANLVLLCRFHHRAVHERGFGLIRADDGHLVFTTPSGTVVPAVPDPAPEVDLDVEAMHKYLGVVLDSLTAACLWAGERLDLGLTLDALLCLEGWDLPDDETG